MEYKGILSAIAILLTIGALFLYIVSIVRGAIRPHVFSWVIWGLTTFVIFLAQLDDGGGYGAWPIGVSGTLTICIALLAYGKRTDITVTRMDWLFFITALSSLPLWYLTTDPLWSVIVLTVVDLLGFGPTIRKSYAEPYSESMMFFSVFMIRNLIVIGALGNYSLTTVLFPAAVAAGCFGVIGLIGYKRWKLSQEGSVFSNSQ